MTPLRIALSGCWMWVGLLATLAHAGLTETQAAERSRIRNERAAAEARYTEQDHECRTRFIVTSCVNAAREQRRETLSRLRREESVLEDQVRKQRTADRLREIDENHEREQARQREAVAPERRDAAREVGAPRVTVRANKPTSPQAASAAAANRSAEEARNQAAFEARRDAAEAHRAQIDKRNAERASHGKTAAPLPTPASAASAP